MLEFTFELNGQHQSKLKCGAASYTAFSGEGAHRNKKASQCLLGSGPIPTGTYYIFDRQSGGLLGPLRDFFQGKTNGLRFMLPIAKWTMKLFALILNAVNSDYTQRVHLVSVKVVSLLNITVTLPRLAQN